jgi:lipase chaperone LimK
MKAPIRRSAVVTGVAATALALIAGVAWRSKQAPRSASEAPHAAPVRVASAPRAQAATAPLARRETQRTTPLKADDPGPLPPSLEGTDVDGWLGIDDDGRLVVTPGARWFFDYFLSAAGEESPEHIRTRIVAEIEQRLPETGAHQGIDLLDRYLTYRERARALQESTVSDDLGERLSRLQALRREIFGDADAGALFGEEEQVQAVDVQRRQVLRDATLTADERQRRLEALEQQLPEAVRQARTATLAPLRLMQDEQQLREAGASAADLQALREQRFGAQAAERLAALDQENAEWQRRLDEYRSVRRSIVDNAALTPDGRARALNALLADRFTPLEQLRVEALPLAGQSGSR